jgi:ATP-binding cassette, subfamily F, member 3
MITLKNLILRRGTKVLLEGANLSIHAGEKVGLVGRNGAGKSSVFALLSGRLHEDGGDVAWPAGWQMAQVAQDMPETSETATEFVLGGDIRLARLQAELTAAEEAHDGMQIAHLHADLADAGAHDALPRAQALILGLGFAAHEVDAPVNSFSGGWRMRLQLARALMCPSDLLLLDEPTNHLDLDALVWLEAWLQKYPGTMVVISHDREFLDAVTQTTVHIDNQQLTRYGGNYSAFETLRAQQLELQQASFSKQQEKIAHLQKFIARFKAKASKAKQAQSRVKALDRMEKIAPVLASADFTFEFKEPANLPNPMLSLQEASVGYMVDGIPKAIVQNINRSVLAGQRIGILGANGQGKSTLVKTVARTLAPLAGHLQEGKGLAIGYFAQQELDVLQASDTPLEHMIALAKRVGVASAEPSREQDLRNFLGRFNFSGDMVSQAVGSMSGGEKARLVLCMIVWQRPNLLLLDEPTNHLDLATREALSMALNEFEGTVMLVSHDRALLRAVCDEFWLVGRGRVEPFDGDLDDYQKYLLDEAKRMRQAAKLALNPADATKSIAESVENTPAIGQFGSKTAAIAPIPSSRDQRKQEAQQRQQAAQATKGLRQQVAQIDQQLAALNSEKTALENELSQSPTPARMADLGRRLKACGDEIVQLEERWLAVSEQIDAAHAT